MKAGDVTSELDKRIAAALKATANSTGPLRGTVDRLNDIHETFKAQRNSGQFTDEQYGDKARALLSILDNFEGLIRETNAKTLA